MIDKAPAHCRSTTIKPGYTTIFCSPARGLGPGEEAEIEWGRDVLLGFPGSFLRGPEDGPLVTDPQQWERVGYVAAHRSGPVVPVWRKKAAL
jgi:hypothetical protein